MPASSPTPGRGRASMSCSRASTLSLQQVSQTWISVGRCLESAPSIGPERPSGACRAPEIRSRDSRISTQEMPIAFKEWAVTARALSEGEQLLTLRKGGIREENKHFELEHEQFFLYPTFDHERNDLVRESHHPELRRALEEGVWPEE